MIRIERPPEPEDWSDKATEAERQVFAAVAADKKLQFRRDRYAGARVPLLRAQHGKCAFCESKIEHVMTGDVEHFRPKAGVRQAPGDALERPGYYWLAYRWTNLLVACQQCNQREKGNLFPLTEPARRARSPEGDLTAEGPLFVDPSAEDPSKFIGWRGEVAFPVGGGERGRTTTEALGLNRLPLLARRRDRLECLRALLPYAIRGDQDVVEFMQRALRPEAEFSAMVNSVLDR